MLLVGRADNKRVRGKRRRRYYRAAGSTGPAVAVAAKCRQRSGRHDRDTAALPSCRLQLVTKRYSRSSAKVCSHYLTVYYLLFTHCVHKKPFRTLIAINVWIFACVINVRDCAIWFCVIIVLIRVTRSSILLYFTSRWDIISLL